MKDPRHWKKNLRKNIDNKSNGQLEPEPWKCVPVSDSLIRTSSAPRLSASKWSWCLCSLCSLRSSSSEAARVSCRRSGAERTALTSPRARWTPSNFVCSPCSGWSKGRVRAGQQWCRSTCWISLTHIQPTTPSKSTTKQRAQWAGAQTDPLVGQTQYAAFIMMVSHHTSPELSNKGLWAKLKVFMLLTSGGAWK